MTLEVPDEVGVIFRRELKRLMTPPTEGFGKTYLTVECNWFKSNVQTVKMTFGEQQEARLVR